MVPSQFSYLTAMGIQSWQKNIPLNAASENKDPLSTAVTGCPLHQTRSQLGTGNPSANLMLISEAPGFEEDQADQLLNVMLQAIGLNRQTVYMTTLSNNRDSLSEVNQCIACLDKQITLIQPKLLLILGSRTAHYLLNTQTPLEHLRSKLHSYGTQAIPLVTTYHPSELLRNPQYKNKAWQDLQLIYRTLQKI